MPYKDPEKQAAYFKARKAANPEKFKEYERKRRESNPDKFKNWSKQWREANAEKIKIDHKKYAEENKEQIAAKMKPYHKEYYQKNKARIAERNKLKHKNDPYFKLVRNLRRRTLAALNGAYKSATTEKLLGTTFEIAKKHIESQFESWMTWDNYGKYDENRPTWHIDHIRPCASFDLTDPIQQKECFHYTNLRPLLAIDNLKKNRKILSIPLIS